MNIAIFASHEGTTLQAVIDACAAGRLNATLTLVISNNRNAGALRRARVAGIATRHLSMQTQPDPRGLERAQVDALTDAGADLVLLAGYMRKLGPGVLQAFHGRVFNTHPALLPKHGGRGLYGRHVHAAVLAAGETETGVTIHLVTTDYDVGPIVAQCTVAVAADDSVDTLTARVQAREREFVVEVLARFANGRLKLPFS